MKTEKTTHPHDLYWKPRLSIDITPEQHAKLNEYIPWGIKNEVFRILVDGLIDLLDEYGAALIGAIVSNKMSVKKILDAGVRSEEGR